MDGSYYDAIKRYITDFGELELANCSETMVLTQAPGPGPGLGVRVRSLTWAGPIRQTNTQAAMAAVITAASRINRDVESDEFVAETGAVFAAPKQFQPELLGKGTVRAIEGRARTGCCWKRLTPRLVGPARFADGRHHGRRNVQGAPLQQARGAAGSRRQGAAALLNRHRSPGPTACAIP